MNSFIQTPIEDCLMPVIAQLEQQGLKPLNIVQYDSGIIEICVYTQDWFNTVIGIMETDHDGYAFIDNDIWTESVKELCNSCGADFDYIRVFFASSMLTEFVEAVTPAIYPEWYQEYVENRGES